jgi:YHS domain-containing protein
MNCKTELAGAIFLSACLLVALLIFPTGCKKSEPAAEPQTPAKQVASATLEQTVCQVMGGAINKEIFSEYKGKKVYFCCPECKAKFNADPEKYIAKLPQFKH